MIEGSAVGDTVRVVGYGGSVEGKTGKVGGTAVHPCGEEYDEVYLVEAVGWNMRDVRIPGMFLRLVKGEV